MLRELAPACPEGPGSGSDSWEGLGGGSTATFSSWRPQPQAHAQQVTFHLCSSALPGQYTCSPDGVVSRGLLSTPRRYPRELKTGVQTETWVCMFIATLFTVAKRRKQLRRPSVDEWMHKIWSLHTMEYYSSVARNAAVTHAATRTTLEDITLSERSQM